MSSIDDIDFQNIDSLEKGIIKTIENNNADDTKKLRLLIEEKMLSRQWITDVFLPLSTHKLFVEMDLSKLLYNVPHIILTKVAENSSSAHLSDNYGNTKPVLSVINNLVDSSNTNIDVVMSMIDYMNELHTNPEEDELVCRLVFHVSNEVILNTIKRLKVVDFDFSELMKVIVTIYLKFFIRMSTDTLDPYFLLKRAFLFVRDFAPPQSLAEDEDALETIRTLLPMFLLKSFEILVTSKKSTSLLGEDRRVEFKKMGTMFYEMALSFDVDFDEEIENLQKDCKLFIDSYNDNCKDKSDDEIQEYLYHLAVVQDSNPERVKLDYKAILYLALTNANEGEAAVQVDLTTLLISLFKINAFYTANDYNDPTILNGIITTKIFSIQDKAAIKDIPEKIITQILQQLSFEGESGVSVVKHILKLMPYKYQIWYCLDTIQECPLAEVRALFWKDILNDVIKHNDKESWIQICNIADIEVLKYTETEYKDDSDKVGEKYVVDNMLKFLKKFKALETFEKSLSELIDLYEELDVVDEEAKESDKEETK